jgi:sigma-B regulation protein RsbU (phosphoserine phosphatase)
VALVAVPVWGRLQRLVDRALFPERIAERRTLREMSHALSTCIDEAALLRLLAERLPAALGSTSGCALLWDEAAGAFDMAYAHGVDVRSLGDMKLGRGLARALSESGRPLLVEEMGNDLPFGFLPAEERRSLARLGAEAVLPIRSERRLHGLVVFGPRENGRRFGPEDLEMIETLAALAGTAAENARLHTSLVVQERLARELELAREIQEHLLPREDPVFATIEFAGRTTPCEEVGGDYYDYVPLGRRRLALVVGDAAGKGVPAALMMAGVQATLRAEAERGTSPGALLRQLNRRILSMDEPGQFVSLFFGYFDIAESSFHYANAGHDPPVWIRADGAVERLAATGLLLGVTPNTEYAEARVRLASGDLLLFYTDGVVDRSRDGEPFGEERLIELLASCGPVPAREVRARLLAAVKDFSGEDPQDDCTVVAVRVL